MTSNLATDPLMKICRRPPISMRSDETVRDAVRRMAQEGVGAVAVIDDDVLVGIFSERDLMVRVVDRGLDAESVPLSEVMATEVITIPPNARRSTALNLMLTHHVRHLPLVDGEARVQGMLSIRHLYREQMHRLQGQMDSLESYMAADGPGG